ncbi:hypothetical protein KIPE111705_30115 [Kibdelosporangium persicum]|uniref:CHAT domain-containing protein n=1 Tax=Kibdelosporangium persicum TaxID=2698649 RepID=A0ABX2EVJ6_9PSEU|nr:hypothetical protein [Kibdelosporangium persicum]NRN63051.1 hypothetical protein [Kibdelosporangium persicum]
MHYFGEYNHIYFLMSGWTITGLCDRAHRGETVGFVESEPVDLAAVPREESTVVVGGATTPPYMIRPDKFGRTLRYERIENAGTGTSAARLHVDLPDHVLYRIAWQSPPDDAGTFELAPGVRLSVSTTLPWTYDGTTFQAITGDQPGTVSFLVEIRRSVPQVRDTVIVARTGHERAAVMVRAGLGAGFVPCFVVDDRAEVPDLLAGLTVKDLVTLGFADSAEDVGDSDRLTLTAPDREEAYGPALALAVAAGARLRFADVDRLTLSDGSAEWALPDVLGTPLEVFGDATDELVVCETSLADLLICQAVGYASLWGCRIAFIPPVGDVGPFTDATALTRRAADAVPDSLRTPDARTLTVFTRTLPLHLTPTRHGARWMDRYAVAHLPGQTASTLVPRSLDYESRPVPAVSLGVVFDALGVLATERTVYEERLAAGLSAPIVLSAEHARRTVLHELVQAVDTDLLLIIAHGRDDYFDDGVNERIRDATIRHWRTRGTPIVINNSCGSWTSTGSAFVAAGARAVIGTLWPVANDLAIRVGERVADHLHERELVAALKDAVSGDADAAAYLYVGVPHARVSSRASVDEDETVAVLANLLTTLFDCMHELVGANKIDEAEALHDATVPALRERFLALAEPDQPVQPHLPPPMAQASVVDIDYVLAGRSITLLLDVRRAAPWERHREIAHRLARLADLAYRELVTWDERNGRPARAFSLDHALRHYMFAAACALPVGVVLAEAGEPGLTEKARWCLRVAASLIARPGHPGTDGDLPDDVVIAQVKTGLRVSAQQVTGPGGTVRVDLLDGSGVNRSTVLHHFAEIHERLGNQQSAKRFHDAIDGPGSQSDVHTESAAAARRLRDAARDGQEVPKGFARQALRRTDAIERLVTRAELRGEILGALATYHASRGDHHLARAAIGEIARDMTELGVRPSNPFNALVVWYYEQGDFDRSMSCATHNAEVLLQARHFEAAARDCGFVARVALRAYQRKPETKRLRTFFEYSGKMGRILKAQPAVRATLSEQSTDIWDNTVSIWRQVADRGDWRLALRGYTAQKAWPQGQARPDYELLANAAHPRNVAAVKQLAADGSLARIGNVSIGGDFLVDTHLTTYWEDMYGAGDDPETVYGICPSLGQEQTEATVVAGVAVYELSNYDEVRISQVGASLRDAAGDQGGFYVETWGSTMLRYDLTIELARGLVPLMVMYRPKSGASPHTQIMFEPTGCVIELTAADAPWLGEISMYVGKVTTEFYDRTFVQLPYTIPLDFPTYNRFSGPFPG